MNSFSFSSPVKFPVSHISNAVTAIACVLSGVTLKGFPYRLGLETVTVFGGSRNPFFRLSWTLVGGFIGRASIFCQLVCEEIFFEFWCQK